MLWRPGHLFPQMQMQTPRLLVQMLKVAPIPCIATVALASPYAKNDFCEDKMLHDYEVD